VACFVKRLGYNAVEYGSPLNLADGKGGDWREWPTDLRVRMYPKGGTSLVASAPEVPQDELATKRSKAVLKARRTRRTRQ
jgi:hypothetical protein